MEERDAKASLYIHANSAVLLSIQIVLLRFMRNQSNDKHLGISYKFAISFEIVLCLAK